ncbi:zf-TFIIB domain-containing protein [bacterium]|nr:zf-TFIIB domain-containing protein [bacterium]
MECPVCRESMVVIEYDEIELDYCVGCLGVWFDAGEIELLLEKAGLHVPAGSLNFQKLSKVRELKRSCPICGKIMQKVSPPNSDIILDQCPDGDGIWFDAGEINAAVKASAGAAGNAIVDVLRGFLGKALSE